MHLWPQIRPSVHCTGRKCFELLMASVQNCWCYRLKIEINTLILCLAGDTLRGKLEYGTTWPDFPKASGLGNLTRDNQLSLACVLQRLAMGEEVLSTEMSDQREKEPEEKHKCTLPWLKYNVETTQPSVNNKGEKTVHMQPMDLEGVHGRDTKSFCTMPSLPLRQQPHRRFANNPPGKSPKIPWVCKGHIVTLSSSSF